MTAADVVQIVGGLVALVATALTLWFKMTAYVESRVKEVHSRVSKTEDKMSDLRDSVSDFKLHVSQTYADHRRVSDIERRVSDTIAKMERELEAMRVAVNELVKQFATLNERLSHIDGNHDK